MDIVALPPTRLDLPGGQDSVYVATQRWALEAWEGEDLPEVGPTWSRKGKFAVKGSRSCAELAVVNHLRDDGWRGIWVNAYGPGELRSEWFPAPAVKTITQTGAPPWAAEIFDDLRTANGGKLGGFFDVFTWREPGEVRFDEVKVGKDPIGANQRRFVKLALDLGHPWKSSRSLRFLSKAVAARARRQPRHCGCSASCARKRPAARAGIDVLGQQRIFVRSSLPINLSQRSRMPWGSAADVRHGVPASLRDGEVLLISIAPPHTSTKRCRRA